MELLTIVMIPLVPTLFVGLIHWLIKKDWRILFIVILSITAQFAFMFLITMLIYSGSNSGVATGPVYVILPVTLILGLFLYMFFNSVLRRKATN